MNFKVSCKVSECLWKDTLVQLFPGHCPACVFLKNSGRMNTPDFLVSDRSVNMLHVHACVANNYVYI